jgi:hypothetical protein
MKIRAAIWAVALVAMARVPAIGGEAGPLEYVAEAPRPHFFQRLQPAGGWDPDGRGLIHWWDPGCYPRWCGPDDYCRKPFPNVCRPLLGPGQPGFPVPPSR